MSDSVFVSAVSEADFRLRSFRRDWRCGAVHVGLCVSDCAVSTVSDDSDDAVAAAAVVVAGFRLRSDRRECRCGAGCVSDSVFSNLSIVAFTKYR